MLTIRLFPNRASVAARYGMLLVALTTSQAAFGQASRLTPEAQQKAFQQIAELETRKEHWTSVEAKIDSALLDQITIAKGKRLTPSIAAYSTGIKVNASGKVVVELTANVSNALLTELRRRGAEILDVLPRYRSILMRTPLLGLTDIAALPGVQHVSRQPIMVTNVTSEGDRAHAANQARTTYGLSGSGIRVGVLSDSIQNLATSQAAHELPNNVQVLDGQGGTDFVGNTGEGTAMLEIVHDLAPNADLSFATAYSTQARFAQNIRDLAAAGCHVIVDDVQYLAESAFQDDVVAQAVNDVTGQGVHYFSAAGNEGRLSNNTSGVWQGDFKASAVTVGSAGHPAHSFGATVLNGVQYSARTNFNFTLQWADPKGASTNDYDLYVANSSGQIVFASNGIQKGVQDPFESISLTSATPQTLSGYSLIVVRYSGSSCYLRLSTNGGRLAVATAGATYGHACAADANCIAAASAHGATVPFTPTSPLETYSSDGPRKIFFNANGTPITPGKFLATGGAIRRKPDLTGADYVDTSVSGFIPFAGTSAAAPHVAAIAALLLEVQPTVTPASLRDDYLAKTTWVSTDPGAGAGIVNALDAAGKFIMGNVGLQLSTTSIDGGQSCTGTLTLTSNRTLPSTVTFQLSSSNSSILSVPATVTIPSGSLQTTFNVTTFAPAAATPITVTATLSGTTFSNKTQLTVGKALLQTLTLSPATVPGGAAVTGKVTLVHAAPAGGVQVALTSSNTAALTVPATVTVASGQTNGTFVFQTTGVDSDKLVTVQATNGTTMRQATVTVKAPIIKSVTLSPNLVFGGGATTVMGTVTLTGNAGPGGATVTLTSPSSAVTIPASVAVAANASTATFTVGHHLVTVATTAQIQAKLGTVTVSAPLSIQPIKIASVTLPLRAFGGNVVGGTVTLNAPAPAGGFTINLSSNNASATVPASISVAGGATSVAFNMTTSQVVAAKLVTISAVGSGGTVTKSITLDPYTVTTVTVSPSSVKGGDGTAVTMRVTLCAPVPAGSTVMVTLTPTSSLVTIPASYTFVAGESMKDISVQHSAVAVQKVIYLRATLNGKIVQAPLTLTL